MEDDFRVLNGAYHFSLLLVTRCDEDQKFYFAPFMANVSVQSWICSCNKPWIICCV